MKTIDLDMLRTTVKAIVAETGEDFIYNPPMGTGGTCVYVWEGAPSCLLGRALSRLGVPMDTLMACDELHPGAAHGTVFGSWAMKQGLKTAGFELTMSATEWGHWVQMLQDDHVPWGVAVRRADDALVD